MYTYTYNTNSLKKMQSQQATGKSIANTFWGPLHGPKVSVGSHHISILLAVSHSLSQHHSACLCSMSCALNGWISRSIACCRTQ